MIPHTDSVIVICPEPLCGGLLHVLNAFKQIVLEQLLPYISVIAFDIGVLLWITWLRIASGNPLLFSPLNQHMTDIFRAIIYSDRLWPATP